MQQIIIVSKTRMSNAVCVGALASNGRYLRLLNEGGSNQPVDTDFKIRQVWEIEFEERSDIKRPHVEDVIITQKKLKGVLKDEIKMLQMLQKFKVSIWRGDPDVLFDGLLQWTGSGSGYISENSTLPSHSVGFWIPENSLTKRIFYDKPRYNYPSLNNWRSLPYVGVDEPVETIPAGTLVRVSLARWWDTNGTTEERCSLQLSGWYDLPKISNVRADDLPF